MRLYPLAELARAAVEHALRQDPIATPDTGSLRDYVIELLLEVNARRVGVAAHLMALFGDFFRDLTTGAGGGHHRDRRHHLSAARGSGPVRPGSLRAARSATPRSFL